MRTATCLISMSLWIYLSSACSDFLLNASSSSNVISARTMDFNLDLHTVITTVAVGTSFTEQSGHEWTTKYGFLSFNVATLPFATDGLNTEGLSAAWLYMSDTVYPTTNALDTPSRPIVSNLCSYILGNFATIDDVKVGMAAIQPTAIHDATGASLAIEFLDGKMHLLDNPLGVLTNDPRLSIQLNRVAATPPHQAVPAGWTSTDRFIRLAMYNNVASRSQDVETSFVATASIDQSGVSSALHLLNTVVQPIISPLFSTEWIVIRDHKRRHVYFQATENSVLRRIDLTAVNWMDPMKQKSWPVTSPQAPWYVDMAVDDLAEIASE
ncbi:hypothetical protein, variant [Aphanomyces astaci]|uniref:Choloylglycine hydrolase/NAAA C-terminal domain-containing protein n=1 Tax=Aphanomyces astaci TaxID=112090 RepID=W4GFR6_APHAT|nr:hypothetical protein, variant [Aphanomyces astaci]ETV77813.1 hypothetical protein, variant [Aphanomyces astaci]|eukprot:XP_009832923.1 hypothetical protein, variant [Aphanomyces astaci]